MPYIFAGLWAGDAFIDTNSGIPFRNTQFTVFLPDGATPATLYTDRTKAVPGANPATTDNNGNGFFYADPGLYIIRCLGNTLAVDVAPDAQETSVNGSAARIIAGTGSPVNVVTAPVGSLYLRLDGGPVTTLYVKESGAGSTGWIAK